MLTAEKLRAHTSKDLAKMAKEKGVQGWHGMRKEELVKALLREVKKKARKSSSKTTSVSSKNGSAKKTGAKSNSRLASRIRKERQRIEAMKNLANGEEPEKDRIVLLVRDSYWIQAYWEITSNSTRRAKVALGAHWHTAKPVLRVIESAVLESSNTVDQVVREIEIHGGVNNWYIDVPDPPRSYRVAIGYLCESGRFHLIAKSNEVSTPIPSSNESFDLHWSDIADNYEKIFSQSCSSNGADESADLKEVFEEKLRRPMTTSLFAQFTGPQDSFGNLNFTVDVEMIIFGRTSPGSSITLAGEPVKVDGDGTFSVRMAMPDKRQVLPVVACSRDGCRQKTTVLAIERNTKEMEPVNREIDID